MKIMQKNPKPSPNKTNQPIPQNKQASKQANKNYPTNQPTHPTMTSITLVNSEDYKTREVTSNMHPFCEIQYS